MQAMKLVGTLNPGLDRSEELLLPIPEVLVSQHSLPGFCPALCLLRRPIKCLLVQQPGEMASNQ